MSITPAFLDELRTRVPISSLVGRFVTWDQRKSNPAKGDYWAPCPFHHEKTASFHVDDQKGYYYCFGCHEKGDIVGFLKTKANMGFVEAVRELADMAGMEMPEYRPENKAKQDANARLIDMHESAKRFFAMTLSAQTGGLAREYLHTKRGLSEPIIAQFGIGFAPNSRDALLSHLRAAGFRDEEIVTGGLAIKPDDGGEIYDRFRNRIMFPISDLRGRVVAFGGRAMDPNARAKYLNSPESPIFHKGNLVYNLHNARNHVKDDAHIIVAEGYMDVIALAAAGIPTGVAPMGTAITLEQLEVIWRIDPMPINAFDGDAAGQRAAEKLSQIALPQIRADRSLKFVLMPDGLDPDDFIKAKGAQAMKALISNALPMVDMLWGSALARKTDDTPEARASFDKVLRDMLTKISDPSLRSHYKDHFARKRRDIFQNQQAQNPYSQDASTARQYGKSARPKPNPAPRPKAHHEHDIALALVLKTILAHPEIAEEFTGDLADLPHHEVELDQLRKAIVRQFGNVDGIRDVAVSDAAKLLDRFTALSGLAMTKPETAKEEARLDLRQELDRLSYIRALTKEIQDIEAEVRKGGVSEALSNRLTNAINEREIFRNQQPNETHAESNSASFLRQFLESEGWRK